jgi:uncharacterized protein (TIGR00251 family)
MDQSSAIIRVRVQPRASRNEWTGFKEGVWHARLTAPPVEGAANQACGELLAERLGVKRSQVSLKAGRKSRDKVFIVEGLTQEEADARMADAAR